MALSQLVLEAVSIAIQAALIFLLLRSSSFRRYSFLLLYCVLQLVATGAEEYVSRIYEHPNLFRKLYWTDEVTLDLILFLMVITLIDRAVEGSVMRTAMGRVLGAIVAIVVVVPFVLFSARRFSTSWFDGTS